MTNNPTIRRYGNRKKLVVATVSVLLSLSALSLKAQVSPPGDSIAAGLTNVGDNDQVKIWSNGNMISVDLTGMDQRQVMISVYQITGQLMLEEKITDGSIYNKEIDNMTGYVVVKIADNLDG